MSRIRSADTSPERLLADALRARAIPFDSGAHTPVGRPDLVLLSQEVAVFIDGCFWHGCPEHYVRPRSRPDFWSSKLIENVSRDRYQTLVLQSMGWKVLRIWEHEIFEGLDSVVRHIESVLMGELPKEEPAWRVIEVQVLDETTDLERRMMVDLSPVPLEQVVERKRSTRKWRGRRG